MKVIDAVKPGNVRLKKNEDSINIVREVLGLLAPQREFTLGFGVSSDGEDCIKIGSNDTEYTFLLICREYSKYHLRLGLEIYTAKYY